LGLLTFRPFRLEQEQVAMTLLLHVMHNPFALISDLSSIDVLVNELKMLQLKLYGV
jgi:hypothetical protein